MREITCIVCPIGCTVSMDNSGNISGNQCRRGADFARQEFTSPQRTLCTTVKTSIEGHPVVPVRTDREIAKEKILPVMREINRTVLSERLGIGEIVLENVLGTGANIILTTNELKGE